MMDPPDRPPDRRVVLYLRQHASAALVEELCGLVERVRRLEADGVAVTVATWGPVTPALERLGDTGPSVSLTVDSFQAWADRDGYTLRPAFSRCETTSLLECRPCTELRVPTACLAVSVDGELRCVVPCSDGERTYGVEACLDALEAGRGDPFETPEPREPPREDATVPLE
ncbi:HTH domain-containing protein [Natronococcus roseus]|uniref:HTH domain-containing protein n=1 Tax=Natronococcus roseus TaxID=1052014 RepID=UPI00374D4E37